MSGSGHIGRDCPANYPPGKNSWTAYRLVFDQARAPALFTQPSVITPFIRGAESPYEDPGIAQVVTSAITSVRVVGAGAPVSQIDPRAFNVASDGGSLPPSVGPVAVAPAVPQTTIGRGVAVPQFRIDFSLGDNIWQTMFVDCGCVVSLPALHVSVAAITQTLLVPASLGGAIVQAGTTVAGGLLTETVAMAGIAWSKGAGISAPQGMATYTQISELNAERELTEPVVFERPPFARRVQPVAPRSTAGVWSFVSELGTPTFLTTPPAASNVGQERWDVPHNAAGIVFTPTPPVAEAGELMSVIWELGVR